MLYPKNKLKHYNKDQITRKEALKKLGTYAAYAALGTMVLLSPKASQAGTSYLNLQKGRNSF